MRAITGVSASTANNMIRDAGVVYFNIDTSSLESDGLEQALTAGTKFGATRGGNTFSVGRTLRQMEADGLLGPTKGMVRRDQVAPTLTVNPIEMTPDVIINAIAGASGEDTAGTTDEFQKITGGEITSASYLDNVALVTYQADSDSPVLFVVQNVLVLDAPDFSTSDSDEMVASLTFAAHFDPASPGVEPWAIYHHEVIGTP